MLSNPSTILLLGTDHSLANQTRTGFQRADSIMLLRTDPSRAGYYLSIPATCEWTCPGTASTRSTRRTSAAASLAIRTIRSFTDVEVNHVVIVDFDAFTKVIDNVGGVDIDVPAPILSNKFDCPYATQARCDRWQGWRFARGKQHMDGQRARVYSRIRENKLNPAESDITRTERQQAVIQALLEADEPGMTLEDAVHRRRRHEAAHDRPVGGGADPARASSRSEAGTSGAAGWAGHRELRRPTSSSTRRPAGRWPRSWATRRHSHRFRGRPYGSGCPDGLVRDLLDVLVFLLLALLRGPESPGPSCRRLAPACASRGRSRSSRNRSP